MFNFYFWLLAAVLCLSEFSPHTFALFEHCNHIVRLEAGQQIYMNSPYYPNDYPVGSACRYAVEAPTDYVLKFKCQLKLNVLQTDTRCQHETFHFNPEGNELLTQTEYFCGNGDFERKSLLNRAVISYISMPQYKRQAQIQAGHVLLKDKPLTFAPLTNTTNTTKTTNTTTTRIGKPKGDKDVSIEEQTETEYAPTVSGLDQGPASDTSEPESDADFADELLNAIADVSVVDDALAYVNGFLYSDEVEENEHEKDDDEEENEEDEDEDDGADEEDEEDDEEPLGRARSTAGTKRQLTSRLKSKLKRGRIVSPGDVGALNNGTVGGGRFSCLVSALEPCNCGWTTASNTLKVAGTASEAGINEYTAMAGVMTKRLQKIFCGAAIIHQHYLLSAAHCFDTPQTSKPDALLVVVGEHDLNTVYETLNTQRYNIAEIMPHEQFSAKDAHLRNDIALLRTRDTIVWNRSVGPACLPWRSLNFSLRPTPVAGQRVEVAGWGTTSFGGVQSQRLLKATLDVIGTTRCRLALKAATPAHTFCTYTPGRDTCQYDSGGALYARVDGYLTAVGIVSYGYACATNQPSVNTRISAFLPWIRSKTPDVSYCVK